MANYDWNPTVRCGCRGQVICCYNLARKGRSLRIGRDIVLTTQITYDVNQIPAEALPSLRNQVLALLKSFATGPRPIRIQLCVCLAILAIQMTEWKDVVPTIVSTLGDNADSHACILDFLKVLPEEVTGGRKINLTVCGPKHTILRTSTTAFGWRENTWITV